MPGIEPRDTYVDEVLTNMLDGFVPKGFIADKIFPVIPVGKQAGGFPKWDRGEWFRVPGSTERAPGTEPRKVDFHVGTATYFCPNYALGSDWTREEIANTMMRSTYRQAKTEIVRTALLLDYEARVSAQVTSTSNVGTYSTPASHWGDPDNSTPLYDLENAINAVKDATGYRPNRAIIGGQVMSKLRVNAQLRDLLFPHGGGLVTEQMLAKVLAIDEVLIGDAMYNATQDDVAATASWAPVQFWGANVLLYYTPSRPQIFEPSYGYSFRWQPEGERAFAVNVHAYDTKRRAQEFDQMYYQDERLVNTVLSYLVQSCFS